MTQLDITQARPSEIDVVLDVLDEAAAWLRENNIEQWPAKFSGPDDWRNARIRAYVESGQTWLVRTNTTDIAVFTLAGADPDYAHGWPDDPEEGLYIYRMAIRRTYAGRDIGTHLLNWAAARAAALGKRWLRLDCHRHNHDLQRYYELRGFEHVGAVVTTIDPGAVPTGETYTRGSGALYQRPAGSIRFPKEDHQNLCSPHDTPQEVQHLSTSNRHSL